MNTPHANRVRGQIRDYYFPTPSQVANGKQQEAFEHAKQQYIANLKKDIAMAEQITYNDAFPKLVR